MNDLANSSRSTVTDANAERESRSTNGYQAMKLTGDGKPKNFCRALQSPRPYDHRRPEELKNLQVRDWGLGRSARMSNRNKSNLREDFYTRVISPKSQFVRKLNSHEVINIPPSHKNTMMAGKRNN